MVIVITVVLVGNINNNTLQLIIRIVCTITANFKYSNCRIMILLSIRLLGKFRSLFLLFIQLISRKRVIISCYLVWIDTFPTPDAKFHQLDDLSLNWFSTNSSRFLFHFGSFQKRIGWLHHSPFSFYLFVCLCVCVCVCNTVIKIFSPSRALNNQSFTKSMSQTF